MRLTPIWLGVLAGCAGPWRPPIDTVQREDLPGAVALADYAPDRPGWRWVYRRTRDDREPTEFVRRFTDHTYVEGALVGRVFKPLATYLVAPDGPASTTQPGPKPAPPQRRGRAPLRGEFGVIVTFDPPLTPLPAELTLDEPAVVRADLKCYDEYGRHRYDGKAKRTVALEGLEDVHIDEAEFKACLRLRIKTQMLLRWGPAVDLVQYLWLARGVGEVRRVERVTGWVLLLPFSATERFELISYDRPDVGSTLPDAPRPGYRRWAAMAAEFAQSLPSPELNGIRIELTDPAGLPTTRESTRVAVHPDSGCGF